MGHSKQNKGQKKDGQHRAETKEERLERLRQQEEARQVSVVKKAYGDWQENDTRRLLTVSFSSTWQACFKILPMVGGGIFLFLILFSLYVRSVPPKVPTPKTSPAPGMDTQRILEQAMKEGKISMEKKLDDALGGAVKDGSVFMKTSVKYDSETDGEPPAEAPAPDGEGQADPNDERVEL